MLVREVSEITAQWIEALVANETPESNYLDYKRELPGRGADNTREMLRDVTSLVVGSVTQKWGRSPLILAREAMDRPT